MVDADGRVAEQLVNPLQGGAQDRRAQVPDVHRLGDVRRREVDHHRPPASLVAAAVALALLGDRHQDALCEGAALDTEVQVRTRGDHGDPAEFGPEFLGQLRRDFGGSKLTQLGQGEARKREVTQLGVARGLDTDLAFGHTLGHEGPTDRLDELLHGVRHGIRSGRPAPAFSPLLCLRAPRRAYSVPKRRLGLPSATGSAPSANPGPTSPYLGPWVG